jgi:hypothetical protein
MTLPLQYVFAIDRESYIGICIQLFLMTKSGVLEKLGIAARPSLLFASAFALNTTPHEAAHAAVAYLLGFKSTLFKMWVNPDAASASSAQTVAIAAAGPIFSLALGIISWLLYKGRFKQKPSGLLWLMLAIVGIYAFVGPMAAAAFGGDFNIALKATAASRIIQDAVSAVGLVLLPMFMFFMGRELLAWAPSNSSRAKAVLCTTVAPWLIGTVLVLLIYWPLPKFLIAGTLIGSMFWAFAVIGAIFEYSRARLAHPTHSLTRSDLIVTLAAVSMVWMLANGLRLAH